MSRFLGLLAVLPLLCASLLVTPAAALSRDLDGDGVADDADNCTVAFNPDQIDTDADGFGNRCDPDFDQNAIVNFADLARLKQKFFQSDPLTDLTGDGMVNFADLAVLKASFFRSPGPKCATCPIDPCEQGRALLCPGLAVVAADTALEKCLATIDPASRPQVFQTATFLRGITRVARPAFEAKPGPDPTRIDSLSEALDALGVGAAGRDPLDFTATLPLLPDGSCTVPEGVSEADMERALLADLMPRLDAAIAALPAVQAGWSDHCDVSRFGRSARVEIDGSDALLLRAQLHALRGALHLLAADDLDFDLGTLCAGLREGPLPTIESFLRDHPHFGVREASSEAHAALLDLAEALDLTKDALDAIHAEADPQGDDLAFIDATDPNGFTPEHEAAVRARIDYARASLAAPLLVLPGLLPGLDRLCGDPTLYLGALFGESWELRALLPPFVGDDAVVDSLPDPTLGGLLPGQRSGDLRCAVDSEGPSISVTPGDHWVYPPVPITSEPVHLSIRIEDPPVGASPGSAIDPASIGIWLSAYSYGDPFTPGGCSPRLNGIPVPGVGYPGSDVTPRFQMTAVPGGALLLEADLDVATVSPARGCDVSLQVMASDAYGNDRYGGGSLRILERGPVVTFSPPSYYGSSPAPLSITVALPFGEVSLDAVQISAFDGYGCSGLQVNGHPFSLSLFPPAADVTHLLTRVDGPGAGERTWSGLVSAGVQTPWSSHCYVSLGPVFPVSGLGFDRAYFSFTP